MRLPKYVSIFHHCRFGDIGGVFKFGELAPKKVRKTLPGRSVAVFADNTFGQSFELGFGVVVFVAVL